MFLFFIIFNFRRSSSSRSLNSGDREFLAIILLNILLIFRSSNCYFRLSVHSYDRKTGSQSGLTGSNPECIILALARTRIEKKVFYFNKKIFKRKNILAARETTTAHGETERVLMKETSRVRYGYLAPSSGRFNESSAISTNHLRLTFESKILRVYP